MRLIVIHFLISLFARDVVQGTSSSPWHYECINGLCHKKILTANVGAPHCLEVCQLMCGEFGSLWPRPTGNVSLGKTVVFLDNTDIIVTGLDSASTTGIYLTENIELLESRLDSFKIDRTRAGGHRLSINFVIQDKQLSKLTLETDEAYTLKVHVTEDNRIKATVTAGNYFGARNALQTLGQLIAFDDFVDEILVISEAFIQDRPVYPYRGVLLDTARNFIEMSAILRTIEAMGMSKLNTFHWHITDSQSFPYFSKTFPLMSYYGAYSAKKIYTKKDIEDVVRFGYRHGVRIVPEFETPAHVGEGWQWVGDNFLACYKAEPRRDFCTSPPCGQLDPTINKTYEIVEGLYKDLISDFRPSMFHMGGGDVSTNCWNNSDTIKGWMGSRTWDLSKSSFHKLWHLYLFKVRALLLKSNGGKEITTVLWLNELLLDDELSIDPENYVVQIQQHRTDKAIKRLADKNFRVILTNYDALYLDCGSSSWVGSGNNWCSPYKGWQLIYGNSPRGIFTDLGLDHKTNLILGGEVALWTEQIDSTTIDSKLWPRSAAFAETLWSEPTTSWTEAENRFLRHRERLVRAGIDADSLKPEWCLSDPDHCH